jgi:hypothetical protein
VRSRDGIKVAATTSGPVAPSGFWHLRENYVYGGNIPLEPPREAVGGAANASRRAARLERFAVVLAELSAGRPEHASDAHVRKAGELVGVGEKTAKAYRKALLRAEGAGDD